MNTSGAPIVGVVGAGLTGSRVVAHAAAAGWRVAVYDVLHGAAVAATRGVAGVVVDSVRDLGVCDVVAVCSPAPHAEVIADFLRGGTPVVSIGDDLDDLRLLLAFDDVARRHDVPLVVGAGMAPGLSGLLARYTAAQLHTVDELHVAIHGTAGPACARQHHHALGSTALGWHDGEWIEPVGGSGRDLVWFPEPVESNDCYRAALGDPLLLHRAFPEVDRISARVSATRRDRMTARLPMLTPPHASGDLGAVRVEARGAGPNGERLTTIAGAAAPAAELAAAVCMATLERVVQGLVEPGAHCTADTAVDPAAVLHRSTNFGVRVQEFTGIARSAAR